MMFMLRGSPRIIVLLFYFICLWNQASGFCPYQCRCNDELLLVNCDIADLDVVPITLNPELKVLYLSNNSINAVKTSMTNYRNLDFLDLSYNVIETLEKGNFNDLHHLTVLKLNHNKIFKIHNETFAGLNSLKELHIKENRLVNLSNEMFMNLKNIKLLDLSHNVISSIDDRAFYGLDNLEALNLRNNKLKIIPSASFQVISSITRLDLGFNSFESIPENSFTFLWFLKVLYLDNCSIRVIINGAFKFLNSLEILNIYSNKLNEIPTKTLYDVSQLKELHMGDNNFMSVQSKSFQRLQLLQVINISNCQFLEMIEKDAFSDNPNLKTIILNFNKALWYIHDGAFAEHPRVQYVSFRGSAIESFPSSLLPWSKLLMLDVRDNPIVCNCSILWLWKFLVTKNSSADNSSSDMYQIVCQNPPEVKNKMILSLQEADMDCYASDARRQIVIVAILAGVIGLASIITLSLKYRDKVAGVLKTKWRHGSKEPQYQKTSVEEESTILQAAHQSLKMTPVTEL